MGTVTQAFSETVPPGEAISQEPVAGTSVPPDTVVDLVVYQGPDRGTEIFMLPGNIPLQMIGIPTGTFMMGSTNGDSDEMPVHPVTLSSNFQLGQTEVTQAQWEAVLGTRPWAGLPFVLDDPDSPAVYISWNGVQEFITTLNELTGQTFRLPTEAEWEYACRAGTTTDYYFGDSLESLSDYAWWTENTWDLGEQSAHVVGLKLANAFGLFDMHGNVWEWCEDWYDSTYYSRSRSVDPTGPRSGSSRMFRGGTVGATSSRFAAPRTALGATRTIGDTSSGSASLGDGQGDVE